VDLIVDHIAEAEASFHVWCVEAKVKA